MTVTSLEAGRPSIAAGGLFDDAPVEGLSDEELGQRLTGYAGQIAALTARFLELLAAFDTRRAWSGHGIRSCAHWLSWRTGMSLRTAHEHVRVAHALTGLPRLADAFRKGELTYSKVRALTRVATPERETELLDVATSTTADQVERLVRAMRTVDQQADPGDPGVESVGRWRWQPDGTLRLNLTLSPVDGAAFLAGIVRAEYERTRAGGDPDVPRNALDPDAAEPRDETACSDCVVGQNGLWRHVPADIAPAVRVMADTLRTVVDIPTLAPTAEVIVHTHQHAGSESAAGDGPRKREPHLDEGPALTDAETAEATCGATVSDTTHAERDAGTALTGGIRLWWGRRHRIPSPRLVQFLLQRDGCCRHPGCGRTRFLHVHHVQAWADGGSTDPDNLIVLCGEHHRALHRSAYTIQANGNQHFTFHRLAGVLIDPAPIIAKPEGWQPNPDIRPESTVPVNGCLLDLDYTVDVLYRTWKRRDRRSAAA